MNNTITLSNPRGETAYTDGNRVWMSKETNENSILFSELQPIEEVFPPCAMSDADRRANAVAVCAFAGKMPELRPADDAEKCVFRNVWNHCTNIAGSLTVKAYPYIFSNELEVYSRNCMVLYPKGCATVFSFASDFQHSDVPMSTFGVFTNPTEPIENCAVYYHALQMAVLAAGGYVKGVCFTSPSLYTTDEKIAMMSNRDATSDAALMIALKMRTAWWRDHIKDLPF